MKDDGRTRDTANLTEQFDLAARRTLTVDVERYQAYLDGSDMTPEQKQAFIEALWTLVLAFVDLGFGVHPVQQACGQVEKEAGSAGPEGPDELGFRDTDP